MQHLCGNFSLGPGYAVFYSINRGVICSYCSGIHNFCRNCGSESDNRSCRKSHRNIGPQAQTVTVVFNRSLHGILSVGIACKAYAALLVNAAVNAVIDGDFFKIIKRGFFVSVFIGSGDDYHFLQSGEFKTRALTVGKRGNKRIKNRDILFNFF